MRTVHSTGALVLILARYNLLTPVCLVSIDQLTVDQPFAVLKAPKVWGALHGVILISLFMSLHTFFCHHSL